MTSLEIIANSDGYGPVYAFILSHFFTRTDYVNAGAKYENIRNLGGSSTGRKGNPRHLDDHRIEL